MNPQISNTGDETEKSPRRLVVLSLRPCVSVATSALKTGTKFWNRPLNEDSPSMMKSAPAPFLY